MRKNLASCLLMVLISTSTLVSANNEKFDIDSSTHLKAFILDNTCSVDAGSISIFLGNYSITDLSTTASVTPEVRFSIELKNCGISAKKVNVYAEGEVDSYNKGALAIDRKTEDAAQGVAIYIRDENKNIMKINDSNDAHAYFLNPDKDNSLLFSAQYTGTTGKPKAGRADSNLTLRFDYQ